MNRKMLYITPCVDIYRVSIEPIALSYDSNDRTELLGRDDAEDL